MGVEPFEEPLKTVAKEVRPITRSAFFPLVNLAKKWGIKVELRLYSSSGRREAQCQLSSSELRIFIYRRSTTDGAVSLLPQQEHLLRPRERFSLAHELGHCIAFRDFNVRPVLERDDQSEYYRQEECMNRFAELLLVPEWLRSFWLETVGAEDPVLPSSLKTWGVDQCGISPEVVAKALARSEATVGFLKAAEAARTVDSERIFVVFHSSYGRKLQLPNLHAHIDDELLVKNIVGTTGTFSANDCFTSGSNESNIKIAWQQIRVPTERRRREFRSTLALSGMAFWISFRSREQSHTSPGQGIQLALFD